MAFNINVFDTVANRFKSLVAVVTSAGAADAGKPVALDPTGKLDATLLPGSAIDSAQASEAIAAGAPVNIWDDGGTRKIRNADASNGRRADGFATDAISSAATGKFDTDGKVAISGLTVGDRYYLNTTAGQITDTAPTASGETLQSVGIACDGGVLQIELDEDYLIE